MEKLKKLWSQITASVSFFKLIREKDAAFTVVGEPGDVAIVLRQMPEGPVAFSMVYDGDFHVDMLEGSYSNALALGLDFKLLAASPDHKDISRHLVNAAVESGVTGISSGDATFGEVTRSAKEKLH